MNNNEVVYLYSKRDIANIIRDLAKGLADNFNNEDWYTEQGASVTSQALAIWLDRLHNYAAYEAGILEEARKVNALVRVGV